MSGSSLLSKLPRSEIDFIAGTAEEMMKKSGASSREERLSTLASHFKHQKFGSGEAILAGRMARLPSEIQTQRYCGEEALRNLLFLEHLGVETLLLTTQDFRGTKQAHDTVFIPETGQILDCGELINVRRNGKDLLSDRGKLIARGFNFTGSENISGDIGKFAKDNLLEAFSSSSHLIDRVSYPRGNIESSVKYDLRKRRLSITHTINDLTMNIPFFHETEFQIQRQRNWELRTAGLAPSRSGISCFKIPISYQVNGKPSNNDFINMLKPAEREAFVLGMAYNLFSKNGRKSLVSDKDSVEFLEFLKETSKRPLDSPQARIVRQAQAQLDFYDSLREAYGEREANVFLKALEFKTTFASEHKDHLRAVLDYSGFKSLKELGERFVFDNLGTLNRYYFRGRKTTPERILVQKLYSGQHQFNLN